MRVPVSWATSLSSSVLVMLAVCEAKCRIVMKRRRYAEIKICCEVMLPKVKSLRPFIEYRSMCW